MYEYSIAKCTVVQCHVYVFCVFEKCPPNTVPALWMVKSDALMLRSLVKVTRHRLLSSIIGLHVHVYVYNMHSEFGYIYIYCTVYMHMHVHNVNVLTLLLHHVHACICTCTCTHRSATLLLLSCCEGGRSRYL